MEEKAVNNATTGEETALKTELKSKPSNSPSQAKTPLNRTLRLEYNEVIKLLKAQDEKIKSLERGIGIIKKVLTRKA